MLASFRFLLAALALFGIADAISATNALPVVTQHRGTFNGVKVSYEARIEATPVADEKGMEIAQFVTTAYLRKVKNSAVRPVLFIFNGGPGASSSTLHIVALGPKRMTMAQDLKALPEASTLIDNQFTVLDMADLVFIDPPETGLSRFMKPELRARFDSSSGDADLVARFITEWTRTHGRAASEKFVLGESYGTIRAALVAERLAKAQPLAGVFLMGQALNIVETTQRTKNAVSYATNLTALAAVAAYHGRADLGGHTVQQFVDAAYVWGMSEYLDALLKGRGLPAANRKLVADKLQAFTGIPASWYLANDLRITKIAYSRALLREQGKILGNYDARYVGPAPKAGERAADPFSMALASQAAVFAGYLERDLGVESKDYRALAPPADEWKYDPTGGLGGPFNDFDYQASLDAAFAAYPAFRLVIGTGLYDLTTTLGPARYLVAQSRWPLERVTLKTYEGGHMAYTDETALAQFTADIREWIAGKAP